MTKAERGGVTLARPCASRHKVIHGQNVLAGLLQAWVAGVQRHAVAVLLLTLVATGAVLPYIAANLGIDTNTANMMSERLGWRQDYESYTDVFPHYTDALIIVIDGETPELARRAGRQLAAAMRREMGDLEWVYDPAGSDFFERHGLLYLDSSELEDLGDQLASFQPFLGNISQHTGLKGFLSLLNKALEAKARGEDIAIEAVLTEVARVLAEQLDGRPAVLSWQGLMDEGVEKGADRRHILILKPRLDYSELLPAGPVLVEIRALAAALDLDPEYGVRVRITGDTALAHEEMHSVSRGASLAGLLALVMVSAVLFIGLRSPKLVVVSLLSLVTGLIWTAAFAAFAVGDLNLISVAFAVLYIGLGIDYAIHFCLRYRELIHSGRGHDEALQATIGDVGVSLVVCALTTGIGFYAFVPTDFSGISNLGLISGTGMFISLFASLTLLPALLSLSPLNTPSTLLSEGGNTRPAYPHGKRIILGAVVVGLVALALMPTMTFDHNPLNLRDPAAESVRSYRDLLADTGRSPWSMVVLAKAGEVESLKGRLQALPEVENTRSLRDFIPSGQDEKLELLADMELLLGDTGAVGDAHGAAIDIPGIRNEIRRLLEQVSDISGNERLDRGLRSLLPRLDGADGEVLIASLQRGLLLGLEEQLRSLRLGLAAEAVTRADLPAELVARWQSAEGLHRIEVFPTADLDDNEALKDFVQAVQRVAPRATDRPVVYLESSRVAVDAFRQALITALVLIAVLLALLLRHWSDILRVLGPLVLAGVVTVALMVLLGIPFNFANVIALPLLLGIGVDNGIHMVHRSYSGHSGGGNLLRTSTARAVVVSTLTTLCSFGNLAFATHPGMASMGQVLTIGMFTVLVCTLLLVPALLNSSKTAVQEIP